MDFFASQDRARRRTKWLLVYFALAVVGIIATLHVLAAFAFGESLTDWRMLGMISCGVIVVVALGSIFRIAELSRGGSVIAEMLGGRAIDPHTTDPAEVRLRNVVEEMSLASGVPVPEIYVLDAEPGINAFAAGNTVGDAVIGVTRGALDQLTRDELQGVIAHEFSHILNGDMRLNLRLVGVLTGILLLAILGRIVFEMGGSSRVQTSRSGSGGGNSQLPIYLIGLALFVVGSIGVFFAKLIKAAVSRQREFLADASAVQFTRNPDGIAGALWKIGQAGSRLDSPRADEASHMFFGNGLGNPFLGMFATHPPIGERIKAIAPGFDPKRPRPLQVAAVEPATKIDGRNLAAAGAILAGLPEFATAAAHETAGAVPLIYGLLLSGDPTVRARQLDALRLNETQRALVEKDSARRAEIGDALALVDLCLPALRRLSKPQYLEFRENVRKLIAADDRVDLFEFVLHKALVRHVDHAFTGSRGPSVRYRSVVPLLPDISVILSALSTHAGETAAERDVAFAAGVSALLLKPGAFPMERTDESDFTRLEAALDHAAEADPETKRKIFNACLNTVRHDGVIRPSEAALLRAVADVFDCPLPPIGA